MEIYCATRNNHKLIEIGPLFPNTIILKNLHDLEFNDDLPETGITLEENAIQKAEIIWNKFKVPCFADDTGLEVDALNGEPGVYSARYAGNHCSAQDNVNRLLKKLAGIQQRKARFKTVISLFMMGKSYLFEGMIEGKISEKPRGITGFGYDPCKYPLFPTVLN